ncbi:MAG: Dps family protein [Geminicoccaceae bacterium]
MAVSDVLEVTAREADEVKTGIEPAVRKDLAGQLSTLLSDTYVLTIKSHICHWNVVGPLFKSVHDLTEEHYEDLFEAADEIAERIRALGHRAPIEGDKMNLQVSIGSHVSGMPDAKAMIEDLVRGHEQIASKMREVAESAGDRGDVVTEDMLTGRITFHEKSAWMLRALIAD